MATQGQGLNTVKRLGRPGRSTEGPDDSRHGMDGEDLPSDGDTSAPERRPTRVVPVEDATHR